MTVLVWNALEIASGLFAGLIVGYLVGYQKGFVDGCPKASHGDPRQPAIQSAKKS